MKAPSVTLYRFESVHNNAGVYSNNWAATREDAKAARAGLVRAEGFRVTSELTGEYGQCGRIEAVRVELTPTGILDFALRFATGDNE